MTHAGSESARPSITVVVDGDTAVGDTSFGDAAVRGVSGQSVCETENGRPLAPETVARLCCDAVIRRVVLDSRSVPIDVGRKYRTATDAQWAALKASYSSCAWGGCTAPISWCQAHHIRPWEDGGKTDLVNLVPLCFEHHHRVHEGMWHIKLQPDRSLEVRRPDGSHHGTVPPPKRC